MTDSANLPFSQACENNKSVILEQLQRWLEPGATVLELGSGTGQHACFFAGAMPRVRWQPSDLAVNLPLTGQRCAAYDGPNLAPLVALDVAQAPWPVPVPEAVFTANSLHIMPWSSVVALFANLAAAAPPASLLLVYGPFNYAGAYTSESNARFDVWLAQQSGHSAIRDFEAVDALAADAGYGLLEDCPMPANNRLLVWRRGS